MDKAFEEAIDLLGRKELLLSELVGWLKAKGLYDTAMKDLGWNQRKSK